jgi:cytochrome P450
MSTPAHANPQAVPAHVPPELVLPIGLTEGPDFLAAPHAFMAGLHDTHPGVFYDTGGHTRPSWMLIKHADVFFALNNPAIFSSMGSTAFPRDPNNYFYMIPLEIDPPEHRKYRLLVDPMLSPRAIAQLADQIRAITNRLIDDFVDKGRCEFTTEFGRPLPVSVFLDLMGLPQAMRDTFVGWAMDLLHSGDRAIAGKAMKETVAYLQSVISEKAAKPDDRVLSAIVHGKPGGQPLSGQEIFGFTFFLFIAGLDTVFATLNNIFVWLAQNPERRREIIDYPENINNVVEELLRVFTVTFAGRMLTQDHVLGGVQLKKGDKITCVLPAANYDPDAFPDPRKVDFHRPRKPTLAFAGGVHNCMGAHLARLEVRIALTEFLRRLPDFELQAGTQIEYWPGGVVGPKAVPLAW